MNWSLSEFLYFSLHFDLPCAEIQEESQIHMTISRLSCPKTSAPSTASAVNMLRKLRPRVLGGEFKGQAWRRGINLLRMLANE